MPGIMLASGSKKMAGGGGNGLLTGLYGYWDLDESSGTRNDSHGSNNLTESGTVSGVTGKISNAAAFTNTAGQKLQKTSASGLPTGASDAWSLSLWHRTDSNVSLSHYFGFGDNPSTNTFPANGVRRALLNFTGDYYFWGEDRDWDTGVAFDADGNWHHVVITCSGTNLNLYVDGSLAAGPQSVPSFSTAGTYITVGENHNAGGPPDADIDECGLWSVELTSGQVTSLYNGGSGLAYSSFT